MIYKARMQCNRNNEIVWLNSWRKVGLAEVCIWEADSTQAARIAGWDWNQNHQITVYRISANSVATHTTAQCHVSDSCRAVTSLC